MESNQTISSSGGGAAPARARESAAMVVLVRPWKEMLVHRGAATLNYLTKPEAHTFAFSVAANAILSFFPFMFLMMWLIRNVFHSQAMFEVVGQLLNSYLPTDQQYVIRNLTTMVTGHPRVQIASIIILLVSSSGVFLPLEVAFNQIWGFSRNRSYLGNQSISFALALASGILALASVALAGGAEFVVAFLLRSNENIVFQAVAFLIVKVFGMAASVAIFFLIYWLLPHGKVSARSVLPAAVAMGILWDLAKYIYIFALPWLNFKDVYGPFYISVTLMFWAFISGLMVLAGAYLAAGPGSGQAGERENSGLEPA